MLVYPKMNPVAFSIGPLHVHWYGLMYLLSFALIWALASYRVRSLEDLWSSDKVADLIFYGAVGVIVGGRLGNMIFWDLPHFIRAPWSVFQLWDGGMSFHGGLLGVIVATSIFCSRYRMNLWDVLDFAAPMIPIGLGLGRLGNFINGELWGTVTNVPWAMVFPRAGLLPRHPSQLYEFFCEGVLLFVILWWYSRRPRPRFAVCAMFLFCYGCFRFFLEFFRQPDPQYGYLAFGWLTMGQILSIPMIIVGGIALVRLSLKARRDVLATK